MRDRTFDLYRTEDGPVVITTLAHRRILDALRQGERSFGDVVDATGKAKSTVSIHLNRMVDQGLVAAREDEEDARRRFFRLRAEPILSASPDRMTDAPTPDHLDAQGLLVALAGRVAGAGMTVQPLFRQVGRDVAGRLGSAVHAETPRETARNVARFWSKWGLGSAEVNGTTVRVDPAPFLRSPGLHPEELFQGLLEGALGAPTSGASDVRIVEATDEGFALSYAD